MDRSVYSFPWRIILRGTGFSSDIQKSKVTQDCVQGYLRTGGESMCACVFHVDGGYRGFSRGFELYGKIMSGVDGTYVAVLGTSLCVGDVCI